MKYLAFFVVGILVGCRLYSTVYDPMQAKIETLKLASKAYYLGCIDFQRKECNNDKMCIIDIEGCKAAASEFTRHIGD